ncbi:OsmC family protein [Shewanella salipaludis]|uniref:OsmC family protein n=1 Tax=Shewanella salipaludis TaxID=2723052 RepID=A0A972JLU2_9GAMM|nr:OsmC family protein [Shewanella salipaludis]NMH65812.1 OsmC family protein [Shewanella salipaludis]
MGFQVTVDWQASAGTEEGQFCRDHQIAFGSGQRLLASSASEYNGSADRVNPEESLLAALSSCHMLTFLTIAHLKRLPVASYVDQASAELGKNQAGRTAISRIQLKPEIVFADGVEVTQEVLEKMHQKAHANCFIANSLSAEIAIEIDWRAGALRPGSEAQD